MSASASQRREASERIHDLAREVDDLLGRDPRSALSLARRAVDEAVAAADPLLEGLASHALGKALIARGRAAEARAVLDRARDAHGRAGDEAARASVTLALVAAAALDGDADAAIRHGRAALQISRDLGDDLGCAKAWINLGSVHHRQDEPDAAIRCYEKALPLLESVGAPSEAAALRHNLAMALGLSGRHAEADELYARATNDLEALGESARAAQARYNHAYSLQVQGRYRQALEAFARAESDFVALDDQVHVALCHLDRAELHLEIGRPRAALEQADVAATAFADLGMAYEEAKARTFRARASIPLGRAGEGRRELTAARRAFERLENRAWTGLVDLTRAETALAAGRRTEARRLASEAGRILESVGHARGACEARRLGALAARDSASKDAGLRAAIRLAQRRRATLTEIRARVARSTLLRRRRDLAGARREAERACEMIESLHAASPPGAAALALAGEREAAHEEAGRVHLALHERQPDERWLGRFLANAERARVGSELDAVPAGADASADAAARELLARHARGRQDAWWLRHALEDARLPPRRHVEGTARLAELERAITRQATRLARRHPELLAAADRQSATPETLREALPADSLLVHLTLVDGELAAVLLDEHAMRLERRAIDGARFQRLVAALRFQLNEASLSPRAALDRPALREAATAHLEELGDVLLGDALDRWPGRRWLFVPDGSCRHVPFHALAPRGRPVISEREVCLLPSAAALVAPEGAAVRGRRGRGRGALVLGFDGPDLEEAEREARDVAALHGRRPALLGDDATIDALRRRARGARIVHVAAHGRIDPLDELGTALRLADGWWTTRDLARARWRAEVLVLAACHGGRERAFSKHEGAGLARAGLNAGVESVVTTPWATPDRLLRDWMVAFHARIARGEGAAQAARAVSEALRQAGAHPLAWAAGCVHGHGGSGLASGGPRT